MFGWLRAKLYTIYTIVLTWVFDSIMDNYWVARHFPKSLDLAIQLKLIRNGIDVEGLSRIELAHLANFPNHTLIELHKEYPIAQEIEDAKSNLSMLSTLSKVMANPQNYLIAKNDLFLGSQTVLPLYFRECSCVNNGNFNRLKNERRQTIEKHIISDTLFFHRDKNKTLTYLSFGSGYLLQDVFILTKLIQSGYKNLQIHLIDPLYTKGKNEVITEFQAIFRALASQENLNIEISFFSGIDEFRVKNPKAKVDISTAIDFDDYLKVFDKLTMLFDLMGDNGRFYLAHHCYDLYFNKEGCFQFANHAQKTTSKIIRQLSEDIEVQISQVNNNETLNIAMFITGDVESMHWYYIIPSLQKHQQKIKFTLLAPKEKNFFGYDTDKINKAFTEEGFTKFIKQFLPSQQQIEVKFVKNFEEFRQQNMHKQGKYDIITQIGHTSEVSENHQQTLNWMHDSFPEAVQYFGVQFFQKPSKINTKIDINNNNESEETPSTPNGEPKMIFDNLWRWSSGKGVKFFHEGVGKDSVNDQGIVNIREMSTDPNNSLAKNN